MVFIVVYWKIDTLIQQTPSLLYKLFNGDNPLGQFSKEQAEREAAYLRKQGFGAVLQVWTPEDGEEYRTIS